MTTNPAIRDVGCAGLSESAACVAPVHPAYRPDIDGLRAVAVLSVLVFHAFPTKLPGGFVGVDIFFVISGYLISRIIMESLERNAFSFADFYARRIKRIYPALLLVLAVVLAFGWVSLFSVEYEQLGKHVASGAAFVSNLVFWSESGYFDNAAITKPLLHLWSLGVEEQFYIFWPLFLWSAWKLRFNFLFFSCAIAALSFALNIIATGSNPTAAFYSPLTRFWELMAGALLAYAAIHGRLPGAGSAEQGKNGKAAEFFSHHWNSIFSIFGAGLIAFGILFVREVQFPGWQALIPTSGAVLLIAAGPSAVLNRVLLSRRLMVWVGLISYPLYLWHWPLFSFARIILGDTSEAFRLALMIVSVILAWLTYAGLERPLKKFGKHWLTTAGLSVLMLGAGVMGLSVHVQKGLEERTVAQQHRMLDSGFDGGYPASAKGCEFLKPAQASLFTCAVDKRETPRFALLGDSKAGALFPGLFRTASAGGTWVFFGSGESGPLVPVLSQSPVYAALNRNSIETAVQIISDDKNIHTVAIAVATRALFHLSNDFSLDDLPTSKNFEVALEGLDSAISRLVEAGKHVVIVVDNPTLPHMEDCLARKTSVAMINGAISEKIRPTCYLPVAKLLELSQKYRDLLSVIERRHPGKVRLFDPTNVLCDMESGICGPEKNGRFLYFISDHLSGYGSTLVGAGLNEFLDGSRRMDAKSQDARPVRVKDWGPQEATKDKGANVQADGRSAIWISAENVSRFGQTYIEFGSGHARSEANVDIGLVTAGVPREVIHEPGNYAVTIVEASGRRTPIGTFVVHP